MALLLLFLLYATSVHLPITSISLPAALLVFICGIRPEIAFYVGLLRLRRLRTSCWNVIKRPTGCLTMLRYFTPFCPGTVPSGRNLIESNCNPMWGFVLVEVLSVLSVFYGYENLLRRDTQVRHMIIREGH